MGLFRKYVSQTRKPEGFLGKMPLIWSAEGWVFGSEKLPASI